MHFALALAGLKQFAAAPCGRQLFPLARKLDNEQYHAKG